MRATVLARKGVLASDPSILKMTSVQWYFEYAAAMKYEADVMSTLIETVRGLAVNILGLNQIRPTWPDGKPKKVEDMTEAEYKSFIPLVNWIAHPEILSKVSAQHEEAALDAAPETDTNYEALVKAIDDAGGDMDPILGLDPKADAQHFAEAERLKKEQEELLLPDRRNITVDI